MEDNPEMAENISSILELAGYRVLVAPNGKLGVAMIQQQKPDLILCDIMMPELDGYGVRHILNRSPETENIPFIFLTAKADQSDIRMGMNLGADDYITKPFDGTDLLTVVEIRLKKSEDLRRTYGNDPFGNLGSFNQEKELKERTQLLENRPSHHFRKREFVYLDGQTATELFYVNSGEVKTYRINSDGKELITGLYGPGDFIGYTPLLEDKPYSDMAEVMRDARLSMIPKQEFLFLIYSSKDFAHNFIERLSRGLEEAEGRMLNLAYQSVRQRVASTLLQIAQKLKCVDGELIAVPRKDISNLIGTATESLNRTLADFKDEGLIEILHGGIRLVNRRGLEKLAQ